MVDKYAVFGNPIEHSKSPFIHTLFAEEVNQNICYQKICAPIDGFKNMVLSFFLDGGKGANVTVPFKEQAYELADELSEAAKSAKAVNTLTLLENGKIKGDNTDGVGLVTDLTASFGSLNQKNILLIGAGGAARGAILPLLQSNITSLTVCNRTHEKALNLVNEYSIFPQVKAREVSEIDSDFDIIINATAASLSGDLPNIPLSSVENANCYDMMYQAGLTSFNLWAKDNGAVKVQDGLGMLVGQAARSFEIWRNHQPSVECQHNVISKLREILESK